MIGKLPGMLRTGSMDNPYGTVLGYGPAGGGKTFSTKTLLRHGLNPVILACEVGTTRGLLTLQSEDIPYIPIDSHPMIIDVIKELGKKPGKVEYEQQEFGAVVLDSVTQWGEFPLERYMELKGWTELHDPPMKGAGKDPRTAYGYLAEKGRQLYKELFALEAHIYIIAREGLFGGTADVPLFAAPELPGQKLPRELPGWPDATIRLRRHAGRHQMITIAEGNTPARVRLPDGFRKLPGRCEPDIGALMKLLCGDQTAYDLLVPADRKEKPPLKKA